MNITLSTGQVIELLAVNLVGGSVDWRRTEGYTGACCTPVAITDLATAEAAIKAAIEAELST